MARARSCSSFLLVMASAALLGSCTGGGGDDMNRAPGNASTGGPVSGGPVSGVAPHTAMLNWDPVTDPNLAGYHVYFGTSSGMYAQALGNGLVVANNVTTYSVTGLTSGTRYYFVATAYDTLGNESSYSNEVFKDIP